MLRWDDAFPLTTLRCHNKLGRVVEFDARVRVISEPNDRTGIDCVVRPSEPSDRCEANYFASFTEVEDGLLQVQGLRNDLPQKYHGFGLTRALIPIVSARYAKRIRSSTTKDPNEESRTPAATATWEHMVRDGLAFYNEDEDRYYYSATTAPASDA